MVLHTDIERGREGWAEWGLGAGVWTPGGRLREGLGECSGLYEIKCILDVIWDNLVIIR